MASEKTIKTRIVLKHDTENNWKQAVNFSPKKGEIIIYDADSSYPYPRIKIGNEQTNINNLPFFLIPRVTEIRLPVSGWTTTAAANVWSQIVTVNDVTNFTKIDLQPTALQLVDLLSAEIGLMAENDNKVVRVYCFGNLPENDLTIQANLTEVVSA